MGENQPNGRGFSDSVLLLGKDTGEHWEILKGIKTQLENIGFHVYIIKEQPDRVGESVLQKVLRYALSSRFVIVENTSPSGHLYEFPHVAKMAECTAAVLQLKGTGATWMMEDAYYRHGHWKKFEYQENELDSAIKEIVDWAQEIVDWAQSFNAEFGEHQRLILP